MQDLPPSLVYYPDNQPGITRRRRGRGFSYTAADGTTIDDRAERRRIEALAVPPAYERVWICPRPNGHLQATGRDTRLRKQYRYHPDWTAHRAETKFTGLAAFGAALPAIRRRIARDLEVEAGERDFAIAAALAMIDRLSVRVGHPDYATENGSHGITTVTRRHLRQTREGMEIRYPGKGGTKVSKRVRHRKLQKVLERLHGLPGAELIRWVDNAGRPQAVRSDMLNERLAENTGSASHTAKTFRTWNGSVAALEAALAAETVTIKGMAEAAAEELCNTPAISRSSYIHPTVIALAEDPSPLETEVSAVSGLKRSESLLLSLLG
jgi:DNA topoisomerase-1